MRLFCLLHQRISSDRFDVRLGQIAAYGTAILVLICGILKLTSMGLTEPQLFQGILSVVAVFLLCWNIGMLLPIAQAAQEQRRRGQQE
jgi:hypothetical protein